MGRSAVKRPRNHAIDQRLVLVGLFTALERDRSRKRESSLASMSAFILSMMSKTFFSVLSGSLLLKTEILTMPLQASGS